MPAIVRYNAVADYEKFEDICDALGLNYCPGKDAAESVAQFITELTTIFKFPQKLRDIGAKKSDLRAFAEDAFGRQRILINNMRKLDVNDIMSIYEAAF